MDRSKFDSQLMQLRKIILDGISYHIAFQALDKEYQLTNTKLKNEEGFWWQYRGFFAPARNALLRSTLLQLSKVYDASPNAVSLRSLVINARNEPTNLAPFATEESLENIQRRIADIRELLEKLRRYRNRRLVHFDSAFMENMELPTGEVEMLIEKTKSIFNSFKLLCDGKADNFDEIMKEVKIHTDQVVELLKKDEPG